MNRMVATTSVLSLAFAFLVLGSVSALGQNDDEYWFKRVLVTNDDGINEPRILKLGIAFSAVAKTYIVASTEDRSGSSNYTMLGKRTRSLFVTREYDSDSLTAYAVSGYPADCVAFGIKGLLKETPPDLVISGINGGPNLGTDGWFVSGTIGAARTAAFFGIPAIAVSGLDSDDKNMVDALTAWVIELAKTRVVQDLKPGEYLNVNVPRVKPSEIRGVKVARLAPSNHEISFERVFRELDDDGIESEEVWLIERTPTTTMDPAGTDISAFHQNFITIVPMRIGESKEQPEERIGLNDNTIPEWRPTRNPDTEQ